MSAVAIATPGNAMDGPDLEEEIIPAIPPNKATITSKSVGNVLASISAVGSPKGDIRKYNTDATRLNITAIKRFFDDLHSSWLSCMPNDNPIPKIGDISGEINIAPIITAVELVSSPIDARTAEQNKSHML